MVQLHRGARQSFACLLGFFQLLNIRRSLYIAGGIKSLSHRHIILKCLTDTQECYFFRWRAYYV